MGVQNNYYCKKISLISYQCNNKKENPMFAHKTSHMSKNKHNLVFFINVKRSLHYYKNLSFFHYKINLKYIIKLWRKMRCMAKNEVTKNRVAKSFFKVSNVEKNKNISAYLSINIEIIL